jgi:hypothetical protein
MLADQPQDSSSPTQDTSLRCLHCEYNLTGLTENRCPECGEEFDPDQLRRIAAGEPMPAAPWDAGRTAARFVETCVLVALQPRKFALRFPPCHDAENALGYSCVCYFCATVLFVTLAMPALVPSDAPVLRVTIPVSIGAVFASWICEMVLAGVLALLIRPGGAPRRYHFWRGLTHYASGFLMLTGIWGAVALLFSVPGAAVTEGEFFGLFASAAFVFCWWTAVMCAMIVSRSQPGVGRVLGCFLVPALGVGAIFLGIFASVAIVTGSI